MAKLKEEAQAYEPKQIKNIAELEFVKTDYEVKEENDVEFPYKYIEIDGERYKLPVSVLSSLKQILAEKPELRLFNVKKAGTGLGTEYTVIPLE